MSNQRGLRPFGVPIQRWFSVGIQREKPLRIGLSGNYQASSKHPPRACASCMNLFIVGLAGMLWYCDLHRGTLRHGLSVMTSGRVFSIMHDTLRKGLSGMAFSLVGLSDMSVSIVELSAMGSPSRSSPL